MNQTDNKLYLKLLSIFHFLVAGFVALVACLPIFHFIIGLAIAIMGLTQATNESDGFAMAFFGLIFVVISGSIMLMAWIFAALIAFTGYSLARRKHYVFCLVMAGVECTFSLTGILLGVFTIVVLTRPSVKEMFMPQITETPST